MTMRTLLATMLLGAALAMPAVADEPVKLGDTRLDSVTAGFGSSWTPPAPEGGWWSPPEGGWTPPAPEGGWWSPPEGGWWSPPEGGWWSPPEGD